MKQKIIVFVLLRSEKKYKQKWDTLGSAQFDSALSQTAQSIVNQYLKSVVIFKNRSSIICNSLKTEKTIIVK